MVTCTQGNIHQGSLFSFGSGFQCTVVAIVALIAVYTGRFSPIPRDWAAETIDQIVIDGTVLYDDIVYPSTPRYLAHSDIPNSLELWNTRFEVNIHDDLFYGVVGQPGSVVTLTTDLSTAIQSGLQISNTLVFTSF